MGTVGSTAILKTGFSKLRKWEITPKDKRRLSYQEFRSKYSQLSKAEIDSRQLVKLDDVAITRFAENHKLDPKVVKGATSVAIMGAGSIMAAFAIKQLSAGVEELRNDYQLLGDSKPKNYEEIFIPNLTKILALKQKLQMMSLP